MGKRRGRASGLLAIAVAATIATTGLTGCDPTPDTYVAIGDSYASGPAIPDILNDPLACGRSSNNYAHLSYPRIKATRFIDVTCGGSTSANVAESQGLPTGETVAPQGNRLDGQTKIVTFQFGGNDIGFGDVVQSCISVLPWSAGCAATTYRMNGRDILRERISAAAPRLDQALAEVKRRAPNATVFVVGYPAIMPDSGSGCWSVTTPVVPDDVVYLRGITKELNAMLAARASAAGAHFVDLYTPSIGHDACSGSRWVEPLIPNIATPAWPVHPNINGMRGFADAVSATINAHVTE